MTSACSIRSNRQVSSWKSHTSTCLHICLSYSTCCHTVHAVIQYMLSYSTCCRTVHAICSTCCHTVHAVVQYMLSYSTCCHTVHAVIQYMLYAVHAVIQYMLSYSTCCRTVHAICSTNSLLWATTASAQVLLAFLTELCKVQSSDTLTYFKSSLKSHHLKLSYWLGCVCVCVCVCTFLFWFFALTKCSNPEKCHTKKYIIMYMITSLCNVFSVNTIFFLLGFARWDSEKWCASTNHTRHLPTSVKGIGTHGHLCQSDNMCCLRH